MALGRRRQPNAPIAASPNPTSDKAIGSGTRFSVPGYRATPGGVSDEKPFLSEMYHLKSVAARFRSRPRTAWIYLYALKAAIHYQQADGSVVVTEALQSYLGAERIRRESHPFH
jgi:hypothetical protein